MKKVEFKEGGEKLTGYFEKVGNAIWVHVNGKSFIYEDESKKRRKKNNGANTNANEIVAPMPGKITKIQKNVSDKVSAGSVIVIMEAMKMEYALKAPRDAEITDIKCKVGDQVTLGQTLVTFKGEK